MADGTIAVDPEAIRQAVTQLRGHQQRLVDTVSAIQSAHDGLDGMWTGTAADFARGVWQELRPKLTKHIEVLGSHADGLNSDVDRLTGLDKSTASALGGKESSLNL